MSLYIGDVDELISDQTKQSLKHGVNGDGQSHTNYLDLNLQYDLPQRDDVLAYPSDAYIRQEPQINPAVAYFTPHASNVPPTTHAAASPSLDSPMSFSPFAEDFMSTRRTSVTSLARTGRKPSPATRGRQPYPSSSYSTTPNAIIIPNTSAVYSGSWLSNAPSPGFGYSGSPDDWFQTVPASAPVIGAAVAPKGARSRSIPRKEEESGSLSDVLLEKKKKRRESHNLVERRRRDNINERIAELATLIPPALLEFNPDIEEMEGKQRSSQALAAQSKLNKGSILTKTVQYIRSLQEMVYLQSQKLQELGAGDEDRNAAILALANSSSGYGNSPNVDSCDVNDSTDAKGHTSLEEESMEVEA